jgi:hypothetical protein
VDVVAVDRHVAGRASRTLGAAVVDHRDAMPRIRPPHAPGPRGPEARAIADDVVDLGLPEHLVDRDAELVAAVGEDGVTDRLAGAHDPLEHEPVALARPRHRLHHRLQRGREQEAVGDAVALHQRECGIR